MAQTDDQTLPLFPLHAVLLPGAPLGLRVFEPRYLDLVAECGRKGSGFGICLGGICSLISFGRFGVGGSSVSTFCFGGISGCCSSCVSCSRGSFFCFGSVNRF